ncbi:MAG: TM2 domain-containing protein [Clostridiales bacterium]|nr:TM2 domain-containing protein [Clostridiales bacterium]
MENKDNSISEVGGRKKFCKYCGSKIMWEAVICPHCGCQVEELKSERHNIIINNSADNHANNESNSNAENWQSTVENTYTCHPNARSKWIALLLCLFLGGFGAHKFYEGKNGMGVLYLFTVGLFGIGWAIDFIILLFKPNTYYV